MMAASCLNLSRPMPWTRRIRSGQRPSRSRWNPDGTSCRLRNWRGESLMPTPKRNRRMFIREALVILVFAVPSGTAEPQPQLDVTNRIAITQLRKELLADSKDEYQRLVSGDY